MGTTLTGGIDNGTGGVGFGAPNENGTPIDESIYQSQGYLNAIRNATVPPSASYFTPVQTPVYTGGVSYSPPPVTTVSTPAPVTTNFTPVQNNLGIKNNTQNIGAANWVSPSQIAQPQMIQIGNKSYPANSIVAQNAQPIAPFQQGPGGMMTPVYDYGAGQMPGGQAPMSIGAQGGNVNLNPPDISPYMASPYENGLPTQPNYSNGNMSSQAFNAAMASIGYAPPQNQATGGAPAQFAPGGSPYGNPLGQGAAPNPMAGPQLWGNDAMGVPYMPNMQRPPAKGLMGHVGNFVHRLADATPEGQARIAGQYKFGYDRWEKDAAISAMKQQTIAPALLNAAQVEMTQRGLDYRDQFNAYNKGAQSVLDSLLKRQEAQTQTYEQAYKAAADASLLPALVKDPRTGYLAPNQYKYQLLNQANQVLNYPPEAIASLAAQQDPIASEKFAQMSILTAQNAWNLKSSMAKLGLELTLLKAQASQANASAANLGAQARNQSFQTGQDMQVAKFIRMGKVADAMNKVSDQLFNAQTRDQRVAKADADTIKATADALAAQYQAAGAPVKIATDLANAKAHLMAVPGKDAGDLNAIFDGAIMGALGVQTHQVPVQDPSNPNQQAWQGRPVNAPPAVRNMMYPQRSPAPRYGVSTGSPIRTTNLAIPQVR